MNSTYGAFIKYALAGAIMFLFCSIATAQSTVQMTGGDTLLVDLCSMQTGTIVDDGGTTGNYSDAFDGAVVLTATPGVTITLTGNYNTESCCDYIEVTDAYGIELANVRGTGTISVNTTSGRMKVRFHSDYSVVYSGFSLDWSTDGVSGMCTNGVNGLTIGGVTSTSANLTWSADNPSGPFIVMVGETVVDSNVTDTTYTLTSLNPNSQYEIFVVSMADRTNRCCGDYEVMRTACGVGSMPLRESFEDFAIGSVPTCWTTSVNFDDGEWQPQVDGVHSSAGNRSLMLSCGSNLTAGHFGMVVSPHMNLAGTHYIGFAMQSSHGDVAVVLGTCDSTSSEYSSYGFVPFDTIYTPGTGWYNYNIEFTAPAGASRIAWRMVQGMQGGGNRRVFIDDVRATDCGVQNLRTQHVEYNQMEVLWETFGSPSVTIGIRHSGMATDEMTFAAATSPLTVAGLDAETHYEIRAYPDCGGSDGVTVMATVLTAQAPTAASGICLDFSQSSQMPEGWSTVLANGSGYFSTGQYLTYNYSYSNACAYLISPELSGLAGTTIVVSFDGSDGMSSITLGTCLYDGDTTGFTPFGGTHYTTGDRQTIAVTVPAGVTGTHLAVRLNSQAWYSMRLHTVFGSSCPVTGTRIMHVLGTSVVLKWDPVAPGDTVLVSRWPSYSSFGSAVTDTIVGGSGATIGGLYTHTEYKILVYGTCQPPCPGNAFVVTTQHYDYPMPYCESFSSLNNNHWSNYYGDWSRTSMFGDCPRFSDQPYYYHAGQALQMASFGFAWDYYSTAVLPDMVIDSGSYLSFYATCFATQGYLLFGLRRQLTMETYHDIFDTVYLTGGEQRTHYRVRLPDSLATLDGKLTITFRHNTEYSLLRCYIDEMQIDNAAYGSAAVGYVTDSAVGIVIDTILADSVTIMLYAGDTYEGSYTFVPPLADTIVITGLTPGTVYCYYVQLHADGGSGCQSYAGYFLTPVTISGGGGEGGGVGDPLANCFDFDELLSWELPGGWAFSQVPGSTATVANAVDNHLTLIPGTAATIRASNRSQQVFSLRARSAVAGDTLLIGLIDTANVPNRDSLFTLAPGWFSTLDTFLLDTTWAYYALTLPSTANEERHVAMMAGTGTLHLDNIVFSSCAMPQLEVDGDNIVFSLNGYYDDDVNFILNVVGDTGETRYYHITTTPFRITAGLSLNSTYDVSWQCSGAFSECDPAVTLHTENSVALPYCLSFSDISNVTVPQSWVFKFTGQGQGVIRPETYGPSLRLESSNGRYQYAILPPFEADSTLSLRIYCHYYGQLGVLMSGTDTSTFVPLLELNYNSSEVDLSAYVGKRIAIRTNSYLDIVTMQVYEMSVMHYSLVGANKLKVWTEADDDYYVDIYNNYSSYGHSYVHVGNNPDTITIAQNTNVYFRQMPDATTLMCSNDYNHVRTYWLQSLPYCVSYYNNSFWTTYNVGTRYINGENVFYIPTGYYNPGYIIFHEIDIDSLSNATLLMRYRSTLQGVPVILGVLDDALDTSSFTPVDTVYTEAGTEWHNALFDLSSYTGTGRWLHMRVPSTPTYDTLYIRNLNIEPCHSSMGSTATLYRWNIVKIDNELATGPDVDFYVEYGPSGFTQGYGTIQHITTLPTYLTLAPETYYNFYFRCDSLGSSCTEMQNVKTLDAPLPVPSCINFDSAIFLGDNLHSWTANGADVTNLQAHTGTQSQRLTVGQGSFLITPDLDLDSIQQAAISLWMTADNPASRLMVGTVTNPSDPSSFHLLRSFGTSQAGAWVRCMVDLSSAPDDAHFIAFRTTGNSTTGAGNVYIDDLFIDTCAAFDLTVSTLAAGSVNFSWSQVGHPQVVIEMLEGDSLINTFTPDSARLAVGGLSPFAGYTFRFASSCGDTSGYCNLACRDTAYIVTPGEGVGCIDATNLSSPQAVFFSGTFSNPYSTVGAVNYGSFDPGSRHTVCYDTAYRDPRTGGLLRAVPEGYTSAVRLGNWSSNAYQPEAEGVVYSLMVDTNDFSILLLRYAAVLQDPMHAAEDQPRFRLEVLDSSFSLIDPVCAAADFVADQTLGWNTAADNVLWKDWTSVGIDLSAFAGQQVYVRLTTFDCNEGSHYGYAYFTLECLRMQMQTDTCGDVDSNTFTAPAGFNYRWYTSADPTTVSTAQSITVPSSPVTYLCDLGGVSNSSCQFTVSVWGGSRYPLADFDTTVTIIDCQFHVQFNNRSVISSDGVNPIPGASSCESALWDLGNGTGTTAYHASTVYPGPGTYTVTLISGIAGDNCTDTVTRTFTLDYPQGLIPSDTVNTAICDNQTYAFRGSSYNTAGTYYSTTAIPGSFCDSVHVLNLTVNPTSHGDTTATACDTFYWRGASFANHQYGPVGGTSTQSIGLYNEYGCDSIVTLHLTLFSHHDTAIVDTVVQNALPYSVANTLVTLSQLSSLNSSLSTFNSPLSTLTVDGCDSTVSLQLAVWVNRDTAFDTSVCRNLLPIIYHGDTLSALHSSLSTFIPTTHGADSSITITLNIIDNPAATVYDTTVENLLPHSWRGIVFNGLADTTITVPNPPACDSLVTYNLTVWPNTQTRYVADICDDTLPYLWDGYTFTDDDSVTFTVTDSHGADSTVTLVVYVHPTYNIPDTHIICPWRAFEYEGIDYGGPTEFTAPHLTVDGCDSLVHVVLAPRDSNYRPQVVYSTRDNVWLQADTIILGCAPDTLTLKDTSVASVAWLWSFDASDTTITDTASQFTLGFEQHNHLVLPPDSYTLIVTDTLGCFDTIMHPVYIFRSPVSEFDWNPAVPAIDNPEAQFYNHSQPFTLNMQLIQPTDSLFFLWNIQREPGGSFDTSTAFQPFYHWGGEGEYPEGDYAIQLISYWTQHAADTAIAHTCTDTADNILTITNDYLQFPNLVTPNGDGTNDIWRIVNLLEYGNYQVNELWIYNQWGLLVYHVVNISTEADFWDPNATSSPDGTYYYRFTARSLYGLAKRNGVIEVLRN